MVARDEYLDKLPESLRLIIQLTDYRTAMTLVQHFGGTDYTFPPLKTIRESHELAQMIGFNNLQKLCRFWGGEAIYIPKPDRYLGLLRNKRIEQDLLELGADKQAQLKIAKTHNVTTRWVRYIKKKLEQPCALKQDDRQLDMFG